MAVFLGASLTLIARGRSAARSVSCVSNLHLIGAAFIQYAADNSSRLPDPQAAQQSWEKCLADYTTDPNLFRCAADEEIYPVVGSSYDWRDTGLVDTTMTGRLLTDVNRPAVVLAFESLPGWHARNKMNAVLLDGSASVMDQEACLGDLKRPVRSAK